MKKLYTVHDSKAKSCEKIWEAPTRGAAIRAILDLMTEQKNHPWAKWPTDFTLFELGEYDDEHGILKPYETKINAGMFHEFMEAYSGRPNTVQDSQENGNSTKSQEEKDNGAEQIRLV